MLIRKPRPQDEPAVLELLRMVAFKDLDAPELIARAAARNLRLESWCGEQASWVAEGARDAVVGVLHAAPPLRWIGSVPGLGGEHRTRLARQVVELEALSVAPSARGSRLGLRLIERGCGHYRDLGYRLALGTFTTSTAAHLVPYYRDAGFHVGEPGEPIVVLDFMGTALHRPSEPHVIQMWRPLHPDVGTRLLPMPNGSQVTAITGAVTPPGIMPDKVVHHDDGSMTIGGGGQKLALPAQHVEKLTQMYATEVTVEEVTAIAAEAEQYGMEPVIAAKLVKASGIPLAEFPSLRRR